MPAMPRRWPREIRFSSVLPALCCTTLRPFAQLRRSEPRRHDDLHGREHRLLCVLRGVINQDGNGAPARFRPAISMRIPVPHQPPTSPVPSGAQSTSPPAMPLSRITDGLSHTLLISEMSGRPWLYLAGQKKIPAANFPSYVTISSVDVVDDIPLNYGWGSWAHNDNFSVGTWDASGTLKGGDFAINSSNYRGVFSFHIAGANAAFADGSVHVRRAATRLRPSSSALSRRGPRKSSPIHRPATGSLAIEPHLGRTCAMTRFARCLLPAPRCQPDASFRLL